VLAQRGLIEGALVTLDDERRARLRDAHGGHTVNPDAIDVLDLDALEGWSGARHESFDPDKNNVLRAADFRVVDKRPAVSGTLPFARVL
jgi:hypothetical protein